MRCDRNSLSLYAVTDRSHLGNRSLYEQANAALLGGVTFLQLREKGMAEYELLEEARALAALCRQRKVPFVVNDHVHTALKCGADGVHLGRKDMPVAEARRILGGKCIIGATAHSVQEALEAEKNGADYLGAGAVFETGTKQDATPLSFSELHSICMAVRIPVVAIGGICRENLLKLRGSGVAGVAVASAVFGAEDARAAAKELLGLSLEMKKTVPAEKWEERT